MNNSSNHSEPHIEGRPNKAASFFSVFAGWGLAFAIWIGDQVHGDGFGYNTDFSFMLFWPAPFTFIGWQAFILPLLAFTRSRALLASPSWHGLRGRQSHWLAACCLSCHGSRALYFWRGFQPLLA